ncbi:hypothetical protein BOSEA31B_10222 [Hyphomicrobiales bacterium]|nr:hypothetical protein BOSEA31B_10222 [Hyphomicrobiales bacterium]CAH1701901.1 hypothetical protein BOSEA1005_21600 [Hyphomicrobiales bacterium]CAI0346058.1 hypothetical protein BO1005MUT1_470216 [Hyphomicrobiales bacterium]
MGRSRFRIAAALSEIEPSQVAVSVLPPLQDSGAWLGYLA